MFFKQGNNKILEHIHSQTYQTCTTQQRVKGKSSHTMTIQSFELPFCAIENWGQLRNML